MNKTNWALSLVFLLLKRGTEKIFGQRKPQRFTGAARESSFLEEVAGMEGSVEGPFPAADSSAPVSAFLAG